MNYKMIGKIIAKIMLIESALMLPSLLLSVYDGTARTTGAFLLSMGIIAAAGAVLHLLCQKAAIRFYAKEGLVCVGLAWIALSLFGCLPFCISGEIPHFADAFFEMVSGFTTTGATIVPNVEKLSRAVLYWRSFSHWLGGMGILVFLLAITSVLQTGGGSMVFLLRAESPGPQVGKLTPHMRKTAGILYILYIGLTVLDILFLLLGGMPVFDAVCTAFGTAGTGGFGTRVTSMADFSPYIQYVCTVFMFLFGVNFGCYYLLLLRRFRDVLKNEELRLYVTIMAVSILLVAWNTHSMYPTGGEGFRHAAFQVASIMTTTGFATTNFDMWPTFSKTILLCLMLVGACAGSTGGGIKCARVLLLFKNLRRNVRYAIRPRKIAAVHADGRALPEGVLSGTGVYLTAYMAIVFISFLLISIDGRSVTTNFSAVMACFNNIGPGLEAVGPNADYAHFSVFSKLVLAFDMLAGRLEIFPILVLLSRKTWKD